MDAWFTRQIPTKVIIGLQLCAYGPEQSLLGGGWKTASGPALAAGRYAGPVCRDLPCPAKIPPGCTPATGAMACLPNSLWVAACSCPGTWRLTTVTGLPTCRPGIWVLWRRVWDSPSPLADADDAFSLLPSMITWWLLTPTAQWSLTTMCDVRVATSGGHHERALGSQGIGWCLHQRRTLAPSPPVPGCIPDQHSSKWHCWEHWAGVFLEDSQHAEYFDSYSTAPLESISRRLQVMGYGDIRYSTKMLQGPFSRACRLYAFYFLSMRSCSVPLGAITTAFRKYDFPYNEAMIRRLLGYNTPTYVHIYSDSDHGFSVDPLSISGIQQHSLDFISFHCHGHSVIIMLPAVFGLGIQSPRRTGRDNLSLAVALATLLLLTPVLLLAVLDGQSQAWKHAVPLTVRNITDAGSPI